MTICPIGFLSNKSMLEILLSREEVNRSKLKYIHVQYPATFC